MNHESITETFLERLRDTTSQSHKNLEELPVSLSIMNPNVTGGEYALYLSLMHDVVKDIETSIYPMVQPVIKDIEARRKTEFIENDLRHLKNPKTYHSKPITGKAQTISLPFALGILYVIEGSSLGGRFILKNISVALGYDAEKGAQYFSGYGSTTGSHWKNFLGMLTRYAAGCNCEDEIIAGAEFAYNAITAHFTTNTTIQA